MLLTTMGNTWQVLPELYGFTNPADLDLYRHHPQRERIRRLGESYGIEPVREIWVITTGGKTTDTAVENLKRWQQAMPEGKRPALRIWRAEGIDDLVSEEECNRLKEIIFRVALHASESAGAAGAHFSMTGGRKTMSSDLQEAAGWFGCRALMHVIDDPRYAQAMRALEPPDFTRPLAVEFAGAATPLISSERLEKSALLELRTENEGKVTIADWPLELPEDGIPLQLGISEPFLFRSLESRRKKAGYHYSQYTADLIHGEETANFLALYSQPPRMVEGLKNYRAGVDLGRAEKEISWLRQLPKAELHCHLGGIADGAEMIEIAAASREQIRRHAHLLEPFLARWRRRLASEAPEEIHRTFDAKGLRNAVPDVPEPLAVSAFLLLFQDRPDLLERIIYGPWSDEARFFGIDFDAYEHLGDLQGSGLLQNEPNLRAACRLLMRKAAAHNVRYLELRCSPGNYTRGGLSVEAVARIIAEELNRTDRPRCKVIFIASRHGGLDKVTEHVELAEQLMDRDEGYLLLRGFDLAGDEKARSAGELRDALMPMMKRCLHFTIHAGENQPVESIWEAVYHLNAERIGHGLTLIDNPDLMDRFRDRGIGIEMCPSSNLQIVGFRDNFISSTAARKPYPLRQYLDKGLRVTVNTDNPGISRTDFTRELHRAARLCRKGLSLWEICRILRNGFKSAFASREERQQMIRRAESEILQILQNGLPE